MSLAGKLTLRIAWDGNAVLGVEVQSTRPQAWRVLIGRFPDSAVQLVPLLYSVCGKAQQAAVEAALSAAEDKALPQNHDLEHSVACEAMQEHLWRLLLDWPERLGLPQARQQFVRWHGELNAIASGAGNAEGLLVELRQVLLGTSDLEWARLETHAALASWWQQGPGSLAQLFEALDQCEGKLEHAWVQASCALLPQWSAAEVGQIYGGCFNSEFAARPQHEGRPMETGALAYWQHIPLLQDILRRRPARLLARLVARLVDLLDAADALAHGNGAKRVQQAGVGDGAGLALVRTARGMLLHHVRIEAERIAEYLIVAPTEWNFHPQGPLTSSLVGLRENDEQGLLETVGNFALSLDPCVEYAVEIRHA